MRFGVAMFVTDQSIGPADLGRLVEERGFASLHVPEHTHMPVEHSPYPGGIPLPEVYKRTLDPFVTLTAAAAVTSTIRLGFGISLIIQRDPIITAKEVASLDLVSGGRVDFGVGAGWNRPEMEHHGTRFDRRFGIMREKVEAMRALWTDEVASYSGKYVEFADSWSWPKPVQDPLPVYVGGNGERVLDRVLRYGHGWMPNRDPRLAERIAELRDRAGRHVPVIYFGCSRKDPEMASRLAEAGVDEALIILPSRDRAATEAALDEAAALVTAVG